ncbi:hypothetical protein M758_1G268800 [Ceratodon purpureus]|nr:hypothetical protein M758_1G268800 [Ceratodon purpureus]
MCLFISFYVFQGVWKHCIEGSSRNTKFYRVDKDGVLLQDCSRGVDAAEGFDKSAFLIFLRSSNDLIDETVAVNTNLPSEDRSFKSETFTCPNSVPVMHL